MEGEIVALIPIEDLERELLDYEFEPGEFSIPDWEHWLTADAVMSPPLPDGVAHPMYAYYAALVGMGPTLDEIFAAAHSSADAGVMFGEAGLVWHHPMRIGATYRVDGRFTSAIRKESSRLGSMDLVTFVLEMTDESGAHAATSSNTFVFPRGKQDD
jgi:hypothetical protein